MSSEHNKERIIGSSILLGGGLLLSAVFYRVNYVNQPELTANQPADQTAEVVQIQPKKDRSAMGELTADYQTEQRILAEKKQERAERVAKQERMVKNYLRVQEEANEKALKKADKEFNLKTTGRPAKTSEDVKAEAIRTIPTDMVAQDEEDARRNELQRQKAEKARKEKAARDAEKLNAAKQQAEAQKRAKERKSEQRKLAQSESDALQAKKQKAQAEKAAAEKAKQAQQSQAQAYSAARKQLKDARAKAIMNGERGDYGVQVAMAGTQELANDLAKKLRKNGYKVMTSQTTRGVRVIVGHERGEGAATALKNKVNADSRLGLNGAWVMKLKPEHLKAEKRQAQTKQTQAKNSQTKKTAEKPVTAKKATEKKATDKDVVKTEDKSRYGVQVAMAGTKEDAERMIKKLEKHGYKVSTSNTTRGTRIIVGAGLKKADAQKLQAKVNSDSRVGVSGAWMRRER